MWYGEDIANNVLEFLSLGIAILSALSECRQMNLKYECLLSIGDNTSAQSWLWKTTKLRKDSWYRAPVNFIARTIVMMEVTNLEQSLHYQHLPGRFNDIADLLSYYADVRPELGPHSIACCKFILNESFTNKLHTSPKFSQLIPEGFAILEIEPKILSFAKETKRIAELSLIWHRKALTKQRIEPGEDGPNFVNTSLQGPIHSLQVFPQRKKICFCSRSSKLLSVSDSTSQGVLLHQIRSQWVSTLSKIPSQVWIRSSSCVSDGMSFMNPQVNHFVQSSNNP